MKTYKKAIVSYKGNEIEGLVLPYGSQRLNSPEDTPEGYTSIGKQQFGKGLKICFIPSNQITKTIHKPLKPGEEWISGYKTNLQLKEDKRKLINTVKECYKKDPSENHKNWMIKAAQNNMGLNSYPEEAKNIVLNNWK